MNSAEGRSGRHTISDAQSHPVLNPQKASSKAKTHTNSRAKKPRIVDELPSEATDSGCSGRETDSDAQISPDVKYQKASSTANAHLKLPAKRSRAAKKLPAEASHDCPEGGKLAASQFEFEREHGMRTLRRLAAWRQQHPELFRPWGHCASAH